MDSAERSLKLILLSSLLALVVLASFGGGVVSERYLFHPRGDQTHQPGSSVSSIGQDADAGNQVDLKRFDEILRLLGDEYYYGPIDRNERLYDALEGMVNGLPDNYTVFLPPEESKASRQALSGEYDGIGVWVDMASGRLTVVSPMRDSPAETAGLLAGDVIVSIDGTPVEGKSQDEAVRLIRGPAGSLVHLVIERAGVVNPLTFDVERAKISTPSVSYSLRDGGIALISVSVFGDRTTVELDQALQQARQDEAQGIVLDLRNNGGGWVSAAQEMIGRFVTADAGPAFFEDQAQSAGRPATQPILRGAGDLVGLPLAVLINGGTASASEIVAGALQDYGRAKLVGTKTFGKGSIQRIHTFDDGSSVRITTAEWLTPKRQRIQDHGLQPDIQVEPADAQSTEPADPQLERALAHLRGGS